MVKKIEPTNNIERISIRATNWVGTPQSVLVHTLLFIGIFSLYFFGFGFDQILLILTTAVSLEAIYLAIFIQMTVNRNTKSLEEVEEDIDEIQEEVEDITEDIAEEDTEGVKTRQALQNIMQDMKTLQGDLNQLRKSGIIK